MPKFITASIPIENILSMWARKAFPEIKSHSSYGKKPLANSRMRLISGNYFMELA